MPVEFISELAEEGESKLCLLVIDGLGGLPHGERELTELEAARTPNLDKLASKSEVGLLIPVMPGVTPGSGPGHLGLFGYDPMRYEIPRGALSAAGVGFEQTEKDVAIRANFATVDHKGNVADRRAGRIATEKSSVLCERLEKEIRIKGAEVFVRPEKEHRAVVVFRGEGLSGGVCDTDPQAAGIPWVHPTATDEKAGSKKTAAVAEEFLRQVAEILKGELPANMMLLRGFACKPKIPGLKELYKLNAAAVAAYPMYRGIARLLGMELLDAGESFEDEFRAAVAAKTDYDYFFIHIKPTDSAGEDGDFERKVAKIEETDKALPVLLEGKMDVLAVTGDHSTPADYKAHSWHPVPALLNSRYSRKDKVKKFGESDCRGGSLGIIEARYLMGLMLANGKRLMKYGA